MENKRILNANQSGFRKKRRCMDNLINIEKRITEATNQGKNTILVSFDLKKAYDRVRRRHTLENLIHKGLKGNMMHFLDNSLTERKTITIMGKEKSSEMIQETGLIQGSVISVTLFLVAVNELLNQTDNQVHKSLYADDLTMIISGNDLKEMKNRLQKEITKVIEVARKIGCEFSKDKTVAMFFGRKNRKSKPPELKSENSPIKYVKEHKILGIYFDDGLTWKKHITEVKLNANKRINVIKMLSNKKYGLKYNQLLNLHENFTLSTIDYGAVLYSGASKTNLNKLDSVHTSGLRLAIGAFRTSPTQNILIEAGFLPLRLRREVQTATYATDILQNMNHPERITMIKKMKDESSNMRKNSFFDRAKVILNEIDLTKNEFLVIESSNKVPWTNSKIKIDLDLTKHSKEKTNSAIFQALTKEKLQKYENYEKLYTDGSRIGTKVGWGVKGTNMEQCGCVTEKASVHTAELYAILKSIEFIEKNEKEKFCICSDSLAAIKSIQKILGTNDISEIIRKKLENTTKDIVIIWVPAHVGIEGNEEADRLAKVGGEKMGRKEMGMTSKKDIKNWIKNKIWEKWEQENENNIVLNLRGNCKRNKALINLQRHEAIVFTRLRIGHTRLTHGHLFDKTNQPRCNCGEKLNTDHILNCQNGDRLRKKLNLNKHDALIGDSIKEARKVINYLKCQNLFHEI